MTTMHLNLHSPFIISSALAPALRVADATISLLKTSRTTDDRIRCTFEIQTPEFTHIDGEMRTGMGGDTIVSMFENYLGFLSACAESYPDGENADLFPPTVGEWAKANSDDIDAVRCSICDESGIPRNDLIQQGA